MDRISRHRGEIGGQESRKSGHDDGVDHTTEYGLCTVDEVVPVLEKMSTGYGRESLGQLTVGSGGINKQYVEPAEAQERKQYQHYIRNDPAILYAQSLI